MLIHDTLSSLAHSWNSIGLPLALSKPSRKLQLFQDSFTQSGGYLEIFWFIMGAIIVISLIVVLRGWYDYYHREHDLKSQAEHLFSNLLFNIDLTQNERQLLLQLVREARIKHPVMILLSPGLLRSSCDLWLKEKKPGKKAGLKLEQIDRVSWKLFGQRLAG